MIEGCHDSPVMRLEGPEARGAGEGVRSVGCPEGGRNLRRRESTAPLDRVPGMLSPGSRVQVHDCPSRCRPKQDRRRKRNRKPRPPATGVVRRRAVHCPRSRNPRFSSRPIRAMSLRLPGPPTSDELHCIAALEPDVSDLQTIGQAVSPGAVVPKSSVTPCIPRRSMSWRRLFCK